MPSLHELGTPANHLGAEITSLAGVTRAGWFERHMLARVFKKESVSQGPNERWLDRDWGVRFGTVNDLVFKVGFETIVNEREDAENLSVEVHELLTTCFGQPEAVRAAIWIWRADDGNVVMQLASVMGERRVMVFVTSSIARHAKLM